LEKWRVILRLRKLITLTMIVVGIVLIASGALAATYHYPYYFPISLIGFSGVPAKPKGYIYPYTLVGLVLGILGLVMLIIGPLLLKYDIRIVKLEK